MFFSASIWPVVAFVHRIEIYLKQKLSVNTQSFDVLKNLGHSNTLWVHINNINLMRKLGIASTALAQPLQLRPLAKALQHVLAAHLVRQTQHLTHE